MIHPTAQIHREAKVDPSVEVGPYSIIDKSVEVGTGCVIGPHVHLTGQTVIGADNQFHSGSVIGDAPQDLKYQGDATRLVVGDKNIFREHVTVHRSNRADEETIVGSRNYFMAHSHVGHNCRVGNEVILANGALLGGHVDVGDRAFISGHCLVHQYVRIGTLSLMQGGSAVSKDLPPYVIVSGVNRIRGLNVVGLRRAGISSQERLDLRKLYRRLFVNCTNFRESLEGALDEFQSESARMLIEFIRTSKRGVCFPASADASKEQSESSRDHSEE